MRLMEVFTPMRQSLARALCCAISGTQPETPFALAQISRKTPHSRRIPKLAAWKRPCDAESRSRGHCQRQGRSQGTVLRTAGALGAARSHHGRWPHWGHIGLDVCRRERAWSRAEVDVLRILADLIGRPSPASAFCGAARADTITSEQPRQSCIACAASRRCR